MLKLNLFTVVILFNIFSLTGIAQNCSKKQTTLKISGSAILNNKRVGDYSISVYLDGNRVDSIYTKSKKSIKLTLACNRVFTFLFQKQDCLDKIVFVNTLMPDGLKKTEVNTFDFEIEMSPSLIKNSKYFKSSCCIND
jgi:hypothetical protein